MESKEGFDNKKRGQSPEGAIPPTWGEYSIFDKFPADSPDLLERMARKGISFDMGDIWVEVEGKKFKITTSKNDFGGVVMDKGWHGKNSGI